MNNILRENVLLYPPVLLVKSYSAPYRIMKHQNQHHQEPTSKRASVRLITNKGKSTSKKLTCHLNIRSPVCYNASETVAIFSLKASARLANESRPNDREQV